MMETIVELLSPAPILTEDTVRAFIDYEFLNIETCSK